jgi:hypothetical protein
MDAENARLLDRLTKQQEINQSLRVENAKLKAEKDESEKNWGDLSEKFEGDRDCWRWAEVEMWIEKLNEQIEKLNAELKMDRGTRKAVIEALGGNEADCFQPYPDDIKLRDITGTIESLKANLVMKDGIIDRLREAKYQLSIKKDEENARLLNWATTAQAKADKLESELADYKRIAEQQEKTMRELRAEDNLLKAEVDKLKRIQCDTCDFCDNERKVLTKRDGGYDEWTCYTCHKEQYPEEYDRKTSETDPAEVYMSDTARGLKHSPGKPQKKRVIVVWYENGVMVEKMLMRKRGYCHSHKKECQHYAPAPRGGVEPTENGWKCCDKAGDMVFIENGEFVNGHYLADFQ